MLNGAFSLLSIRVEIYFPYVWLIMDSDEWIPMSVSMCSVASMDWDVTSLILSLIGCQRTFEILKYL